MKETDRMTAEEFRKLGSTGEWPERFEKVPERDRQRELPLLREEGKTPKTIEPSEPLGFGRPLRVTPDFWAGSKLLRVSIPVKPVSVNHLYRDSIVPGKQILSMDPRSWNLAKYSIVVVAPDGTLRVGFRRRALTGRGKAFQAQVRMHLLAAGIHAGSAPPPNTPLWARLWVHGSWWTKQGDIRIEDAVSGEKVVLDTVAEYLGLQKPLRKGGGDEAFFRVDCIKAEDTADGFTLEILTLCRRKPEGAVE